MPQLALNDVHSDALASGLNRVRVTKLMRRESPNTGRRGELTQLTARGRRRPPASTRWPVDHTEQARPGARPAAQATC